jgi:hypothetical protein
MPNDTTSLSLSEALIGKQAKNSVSQNEVMRSASATKTRHAASRNKMGHVWDIESLPRGLDRCDDFKMGRVLLHHKD